MVMSAFPQQAMGLLKDLADERVNGNECGDKLGKCGRGNVGSYPGGSATEFELDARSSVFEWHNLSRENVDENSGTDVAVKTGPRNID